MIKIEEADQILQCLINSNTKDYPLLNGKTIIELMDSIKRYNESKLETKEILVKRNIFGFPKKINRKSLFYNPNITEKNPYKAFGLNEENVEKHGENLAMLFLIDLKKGDNREFSTNSLIDFINKNKELKFYLILRLIQNPFYVFDEKTVDNAKLRVQKINK